MITKQKYLDQIPEWPGACLHILAQFDDESIVVYQAYRPAIGRFAAKHGYFGGEFKMTRMTWIKPNFLWMMYRSGWGTKPGQEVTLAVRLKREFFDRLLAEAVPSSLGQSTFSDREDWQKAVQSSSVRLQWDPDHDPCGNKLERRAIQLGLRGKIVEEYVKDAIIEIDDISDFVKQQRQNAHKPYANLVTPLERTYVPADSAVGANIKLGERREGTK